MITHEDLLRNGFEYKDNYGQDVYMIDQYCVVALERGGRNHGDATIVLLKDQMGVAVRGIIRIHNNIRKLMDTIEHYSSILVINDDNFF